MKKRLWCRLWVKSGIEQLQAPRYMDDRVYSVTGVRVDADRLAPGIYIKNGRKFIVK